MSRPQLPPGDGVSELRSPPVRRYLMRGWQVIAPVPELISRERRPRVEIELASAEHPGDRRWNGAGSALREQCGAQQRCREQDRALISGWRAHQSFLG